MLAGADYEITVTENGERGARVNLGSNGLTAS
jgi:hypothetical protein